MSMGMSDRGETRESGISVVGAVPWGTHLCQFYDTKQDLVDILVPYFKAGLENNEFCMWVTSEPLGKGKAEEAMRKAVPNLEQYLGRGQIEIVPHTEWYLKDGAFNLQRVLNAWLDKLNKALDKGYEGMRLTGNLTWLEEEDWTSFTRYEEEINSIIGDYRMFALCSYPLCGLGVSEIVDVVQNHRNVLIRQHGSWTFTESAEYIRLQHDLTERRKEIECIYAVTNITGMLDKPLDEVYQEVANLLPKSWQYPDITCAKITIDGKEFKTENCRATKRKQSQSSDIKVHGAKTGVVEVAYLEERPEIDEGPFLKEEGLLINAVAVHLGKAIERKRVEENQETTVPATSRRRLTPLQERFIKSGFKGLKDQEIIELLLSQCCPRESKRMAKECIGRFKNLRGLLTASSEELQRTGFNFRCMFSIKFLRELPTEILKQKILEQPVYTSPKGVFDYLQYSMRDLKNEVFKVIYLNNRNQIIDTVDLFEGTLESIPIRPREIVESAIKHSAAALIFAHNHPSGDPTPSKSDKQLTRDLVFIGMILQIKVLDHIVIGETKYFSFADEGLIEKYEDNFLNLKIRGVFDSRADYLKDLSRLSTLHCN